MNILIHIWQAGFIVVAGVFLMAIFSEDFNRALSELSGGDYHELRDLADDGLMGTLFTLGSIALVAAIWPFIMTYTMVKK